MGSLFQAPRETREGKGEGTKTRGTGRLSRSLEQATADKNPNEQDLRYLTP